VGPAASITYILIDLRYKFKIIIIIVLLFIAFVQGIYSYKPGTTHVSWTYSFAPVLYLQFMLHMCYFPS